MDDDTLRPEDNVPGFGAGEPEDPAGGLTGNERYLGYAEAGIDPTGNESIDTLADTELRAGETDDPYLAAEEGLTWVPPTDPVVVPDASNPEGIQVAGGMAGSALDEPYDADHHDSFLSGEDEVSDRVREALRAHAQTSMYADSIQIDTEGGVVRLRGEVDDIEDGDAIAAVASVVAGVAEVRDETRVRGL